MGGGCQTRFWWDVLAYRIVGFFTALVEDEAAEGPGEKGANGGEVEGRAPDAVMTFDVGEVC